MVYHWEILELTWYIKKLYLFDKGLFDPDGVTGVRGSLSLQRFDPDGVINKETT